MPAVKLEQRLPVVAKRIGRSATAHREVLKELIQPRVFRFGKSRFGILSWRAIPHQAALSGRMPRRGLALARRKVERDFAHFVGHQVSGKRAAGFGNELGQEVSFSGSQEL